MYLYHSHKMCLLAALGPITDRNDRFPYQHAKKVISDIGLLIFVLNLPDQQVLSFLGGKFKLQKDCNKSC